MSNHIASHIHHPTLTSDNTLHVVAVVSNVERYHSRYRLAREFIARMQATPNVRLHVVEAAFGDRQHELEESADGLRLRVNTNAWIKENMINLAVQHLLPVNWKYMAWVDADVEFRNPHWAQETMHQLQHFPILQPWQQCVDMGAHGNVMQVHQSFGSVDQQNVPKQRNPGEPYQYAHSGFAWACTRAFWEQVGGLPDWLVLGSADHHCAWACIGEVDATIHRGMTPNFFGLLRAWQQRAVRVTHGEVGFVTGHIAHHFHGSKKTRQYRERWQIFVDAKYDPVVDIMHDAQGVVHIVGKPELEQAIRRYNRSRNEDSIDE